MNKKVIIGGGSGLVGSVLADLLRKNGYEVSILSRNIDKSSKTPLIYWNPIKGEMDHKSLSTFGHIINLAGAGIADKRWTSKRKKLIIDSRVKGNELLKRSLDEIQYKPQTYISASAIGFYGDRGDEWMDENQQTGSGFLAESTSAWEQSIALVPCERSVTLRIGIVLSNQGGALPKMKLPIKFGMANYFNDGSQFTSWIHILDLARMILFCLEKQNIQGTYNAVAPNPVTQKEWIQSILRVHQIRRLVMPVPGFAIKLGLGEMAAVVLEGSKVSAKKILSGGFTFQFSSIDEALQDLKNNPI